MNLRQKIRIKKLSRLLAGGFDGTLGSEKYNSSLKKELEGLGYPLKPGGADILAYETEAIDEDVNIYILDERFFKDDSNNSRAQAKLAIQFLFNTKNVNFQVNNSERVTGLRNRDTHHSKQVLVDKIKSLFRIQERWKYYNKDFYDDIYLNEEQLYYLEHLLMSIQRSHAPFFLYIFDPNSGEDVTFHGIKHDFMHIMKDQDFRDGISVSKYKDEGIMFDPRYYSFKGLYPADYQESHLLGSYHRFISQLFNNFLRSVAYHAQISNPPKVVNFLKQYFYIYNNSTNTYIQMGKALLGNEWTADSIHDVYQSIFFAKDNEQGFKIIMPTTFNEFENDLANYNKKLSERFTRNSFMRIKLLALKLNEEILNLKNNIVNKKIPIKLYPSGGLDKIKQRLTILNDKMKPYYETINNIKNEKNVQGEGLSQFVGGGHVQDRLNFLSKGSKYEDSVFAFIRIV